MIIFPASPVFTEFINDKDIINNLSLLENSGSQYYPIYNTLSPVLFGMLKGIYELGDIARLNANFEFLFCARKVDNYSVISEKDLLKSLLQFKFKISQLNEKLEELIFILPTFKNQEMFDKFLEQLHDSYIEAEVPCNLQVVKADYLGGLINHGRCN